MQPTVVVSPGQPPPGQMQPPGGFGGPPMGQAPPPPKKSRLGLFLGLGCGCLLLIGAGVAVVVIFVLSAGPGEEISGASVQPNIPFTLSYTQEEGQQYEVWMDVSLSYMQGCNISGPINITVNGQVVGQYTMAFNGDNNPISNWTGTNRSVNWSATNITGNGSASGEKLLFLLPAYDAGAVVTLSGTLQASPGLTMNQFRIKVTD